MHKSLESYLLFRLHFEEWISTEKRWFEPKQLQQTLTGYAEYSETCIKLKQNERLNNTLQFEVISKKQFRHYASCP